MTLGLPQGAPRAEELTYSGSTTIGKGVLESVKYVGSAKGVENLVNAKVNIAGTSRALKDPEKKQGLVGYIIGYDAPVSLELLGAISEKERAQVKALTVGAVEATEKNVRSGAYKVSRPLILATRGIPKDEVKQFIDFMLSKEGQAITARNFVALRK